MAARLGNVLYWTASLIAWPLIAVAAIIGGAKYLDGTFGDNNTPLTLGVIAIAVWLFGRACRYFLAGK